MRPYILGLAVAVAGSAVAVADEKAEAAVKKAVEAHGGAAALDKYKAARFTIKGEITFMNQDFPITGKTAYMNPGRARVNGEIEVMGQKLTVRQVISGDKVSIQANFGDMALPTHETQKEELKFNAVMQEAEQLTPLLDPKKFEITAAPDEDVGGAKAAVVTVKSKALNREAKFYFDQKSGLLVKTAYKGKSMNDSGEVVEELKEAVKSDHKKVNGIQIATKEVVTKDGKKYLTATLSDIEVLEKIDDKEFTVDD